MEVGLVALRNITSVSFAKSIYSELSLPKTRWGEAVWRRHRIIEACLSGRERQPELAWLTEEAPIQRQKTPPKVSQPEADEFAELPVSALYFDITSPRPHPGQSHPPARTDARSMSNEGGTRTRFSVSDRTSRFECPAARGQLSWP